MVLCGVCLVLNVPQVDSLIEYWSVKNSLLHFVYLFNAENENHV